MRRRLDRLTDEGRFAALRELPALTDRRSDPPTAGWYCHPWSPTVSL